MFVSSTYLSDLFSCRIVFTAKAIADLDSLIPDLRNNLETGQHNFVVRGKNSFIWVLYNEDDLQPAANGAALQIETAGIDAFNYQGVGCPHLYANIKQECSSNSGPFIMVA